MKALSVRIRLDLVPSTGIQATVGKLAKLSPQTTVEEFRNEPGVDTNYISIDFMTSDAPALWKAIESTLGLSSHRPSSVSKGMIVVCEGDHGWDDYLLLYHFDKQEALDKFPIP